MIVKRSVSLIDEGAMDGNNFVLRGAAAALFHLKSREILLEGPAGTGKTTALCLRVGELAERFAGSRLLIARKTRSAMTQSVLVTFENTPVGAVLARTPRTAREQRSTYRHPNGSEIVVCGLDNPDRLMSAEYDHVSVFEATESTENDWEMLSTRLRNGRFRVAAAGVAGVPAWHQAVADCNPRQPGHWLNVRANRGLMRRLRSAHQDNAKLYDAARGDWTDAGRSYLATLEALGPVRKKRLLEGVWAAAEGLVYPGLADAVLGAGDDAVPVRTVAGLDWGWTDPTAVVVGRLGQDGVLRIVAELFETRMPFDVLAVKLREMQGRWEIDAFYCDPARADLLAQVRRMDCPAAPNLVRQIETGIAMVEQRVLRGLLRIAPGCVQTLREASEYEYARDRAGQNTGKPADMANHAMDALRYLVCGLDYGVGLLPEMAPPDAGAPAAPRAARDVDFLRAAFGD